MQPFSRDTHPEVEALLVERYRQMTPQQRLQKMLDMNRFVAETQLAAIRAAHPNADDHELKMRLASRWVKPELLKAAFGWDVETMGY
jgi:hypothetical protein